MNQNKSPNRFQSFKFAFKGVATLFREEPNARIHLVAAILALLFAWLFDVTNIECALVIASIAAVFAAEIFNTAIESLSDMVSQERHPLIKKAKDLSAAAVLTASIGALIIGLIIFIPKITDYVGTL